MNNRRFTQTQSRKGAVLPLMAFVLIAMLLVAALTVNSNWLMYSKINAQNTADLSARSSMARLLGDSVEEGRVDRSRDLAIRLYRMNLDRPDADLTPERVKFGKITNLDANGEPKFVETSDSSPHISAIHVDTPLTPQEVGVFFGGMLGGPDKVRIVADAKVGTRTIDIMLCLDASRSMNKSPNGKYPPGANSIHEPPVADSKWFELVETVPIFLAAMRETNPNARVGLVTFGGGLPLGGKAKAVPSPLDIDASRYEVEPTVVISGKVTEMVETLQAYADNYPALGYGTSLYDGIITSLEAFDTDVDASRHIVMLSDGNQVINNTPAPLVAAKAATAQGVTIHTIAFGGSLQVMEDIANETGGTNFTALSGDELKETFSQLLGRFRVQLVD